VAGSLPAAVNALLDALHARDVRELDLPFSPRRVWEALQRQETTHGLSP
jgi:carbon-monoxide dehydrogenase large subunit